MSPYKQLLAAIELTDEGYLILRRAQYLAAAFEAKLEVLHVVEYFPTAGEISMPIDLSEDRAKQARSTLAVWCRELNIPPEVQVVIGSPKTEVQRVAQKVGADLLVIGHHPHRGLSLLISHTDQAMLGRAQCDVLAITQKAGSKL